MLVMDRQRSVASRAIRRWAPPRAEQLAPCRRGSSYRRRRRSSVADAREAPDGTCGGSSPRHDRSSPHARRDVPCRTPREAWLRPRTLIQRCAARVPSSMAERDDVEPIVLQHCFSGRAPRCERLKCRDGISSPGRPPPRVTAQRLLEYVSRHSTSSSRTSAAPDAAGRHAPYRQTASSCAEARSASR